MNLSTKIAWRNIWRHKSKSLIIGVILFLGAFLMTLGNAIVSGMEKGLEKNLKGSFTGDVLIISNKEEKDAIFADITGTARELIPDYFKVEKVVKENAKVDKTLSMAFGQNFILSDDADMQVVGIVGVNMKDFLNFYDDQYNIIEGRMLKEGETGIIAGNKGREQLVNWGDYWIKPKDTPLNEKNLTKEAKEFGKNLTLKDELVIMGAGRDSSSLDVRVPVVGVYKLKSLDKLMGDNFIMDIDSFRAANGMTTGDEKVEISAEQKSALDGGFSFDGGLVEEDKGDADTSSLEGLFAQETETVKPKSNLDSGAYNTLLIKVKKGTNEKAFIKELNESFKAENLDVRAVSWSDALGFVGKIALFIKIALNVFVLFIFFVAIIVIMNTLSMTAMERVSEIGMMRAVGAQKGFLRNMFVQETAYLSFFFGGIGVGVGLLVVIILQMAKLGTTNEFLQLAYGGDYLNPLIRIQDLLIGVLELGLVTLLSLLYPIKLVGKITPLDAISRD